MFPENISKNFDRVRKIAFSNLPIEEKMRLFENFDVIEVLFKNKIKIIKNCFLPIEEFDEYAVSPFGEVISCKGKYGKMFVRLLSKRYDGSGYYDVQLRCNKEKHKHKKIHRLVSETFLMNPENKPQVNHIDGDKENNRLDNLEFCTAAENMQHAFKTGLCNKNGKLTDYELNQIVEMLNSGSKYYDIALKFNISATFVKQIAKGKRHKEFTDKIDLPENRFKVKVKCLETGRVYSSIEEAADDLKIHSSNISAHLKGKLSHVGGFHFERVEEKEN